MKNFCKTAKEVVTALDGPGGVRRLTGATNKQIWHWHSRAGTFPANHYKIMTDELAARGYEASPKLWRQKGSKNAA